MAHSLGPIAQNLQYSIYRSEGEQGKFQLNFPGTWYSTSSETSYRLKVNVTSYQWESHGLWLSSEVEGSIIIGGIVSSAPFLGTLTIGAFKQTIDITFKDGQQANYFLTASTYGALAHAILNRPAKGTLDRDNTKIGNVELEVDLQPIKEVFLSLTT